MTESTGKKSDILWPVIQNFDWGYVKWLHEPEDLEKGKLAVGHVTFFPNKEQEHHLHTGDEQILYTISGKGEHWIDGRFYPLLPGTVYHIPPYAEHSVRNSGKDPLEMIIVYNTNSLNSSKILPHIDFAKEYSVSNLKDIIDIRMLQEIQDKFSNAVDLAIVIKNEKGEILTEPSNLPVFCKLQRERGRECQLRDRYLAEEQQGTTVIHCCFDLVSISAPICFSRQHIGTILCGPVILNEPSRETLEAVSRESIQYGDDRLVKEYLNIGKITKGRLYAIIETLKTINNFIVEMGINNLAHKELHKKTVEILKETQRRNRLEKALSETKMKLIQAQISPHFLFNTLSVISQLAYMNGAKEAAETTLALSGLLRTSLRKGQEMIPVKDELKYIEDYIYIQRKRFQNILKSEIRVSESLMDYNIPFLTLQTLVENAIIHGFEPTAKHGTLKVIGELKDGRMLFEVIDDGVGMPENLLEEVLRGDKENNRNVGLGLSNLKERLAYYYGHDFDLKIQSEYGKGTRVSLIIPTSHRRSGFLD